MKLQIAIDNASTSNIFDIVDPIADTIDIVEVGTPMIIHEGQKAVRMIKEKYPGLTVLSDSKIADGGALECQYAVDAGADIITVLALAADQTIKDVIDTAHKSGRKAMVDLISVTDIRARAARLREMGADYIAVHTAFDVQKTGRTPYKDLKELLEVIPAEMCAAAGGIRQDTVSDYAALHPGIIIAGGALCQAPDVRKAVIEMKAKIAAEEEE
ncbi:MAG: orotidine 5'-phosphate decarboxylase [Lachnospiraceae bacterium]|nr:orotidine 5'-phosphate decarboxylase [Lachnospiraceae bacterium]